MITHERHIPATSSPHIKTEANTQSIMLDVVIALVPAMALAVFTFGPRALTVTAVSVASCVFFEWLYRYLMGKHRTVEDLSAVVTGILLAYCLPVSVSMWVPIVGSAFAIIIVKQLYGGLGKNFMNPALAARAALAVISATMMTRWVAPVEWADSATKLPLFAAPVDAVTAATPLSYLKMTSAAAGNLPESITLTQLFFGRVGGCIGETSALCLIAGGLYLLYRRVITLHIPLSYLGTVAILTFLFPRGHAPLEWMLAHLLSGGLMLGAIFMATDYVTSPVSQKGQIIYGIGCGALTVFIRYFGAYPEGVSYAILLMNSTVWIIDKYTRPRIFGHPKRSKKEAKAK